MKDANKIIKSQKLDEAQKIEQLKGLGFSDALAVETMKPDFCGRVGFPGFALANNSAEIKRVQDRIKRLEKLENATTTESVINGVRIVDNVEENRLQMFFDGVPAQETRDKLKRRGSRWSRYNGCWQRHRSNAATYYAKQIAGEKV